MFDWFEGSLDSGDPVWWDGASPEFIDNVADSGRAFYVRFIPDGLRHVPGLEALDIACGAGIGAIRLARTYPYATVVGADGDAHSLDVARRPCRGRRP